MNRKEAATQLAAQLAAVGIYAMYGGSKGHGFWLMEAIEPGSYTDREIRAGRGFELMLQGREVRQTRTIENDGKRSGNPYFTMFSDAKALLAKRTAELAVA